MVKIDKRFNINKYFNSYKEIYRSIFLEFYGEEYADKINNAFDNFSFIGYLTTTSISNLIYDLCNSISGKLEDEFLKESGLNSIPNIKVFAFFWGFEKFEKCPLYKILNRSNGYESELKTIFNISSDDTDYEEKIKQGLKIIDATKDLFYIYKQKYDEQIKRYQEYINYNENLEEIESNSQSEYINYFIKNVFYSISQSDQIFYMNHIREFKNPETSAEYFRKMRCFKNYIYNFVGSINFKSDGLINSFSEENEKVINDYKYIRQHRINYFKNLGLDLGDNYEDYVNSEEAQKLWPTEDDIKRVTELKDYIYEQTIKYYYSTIPMYQEIKEILENKGFTDLRCPPFVFSTYLKDKWNITPNFIIINKEDNSKMDDRIVLHPIILFSADVTEKDFDQTIIHELNHLVEYRIIKIITEILETGVSESHVMTETGFNNHNEEYIKELKRLKYELFNETINEILTSEITALMHSKGIYLFTEESDLSEELKKNATKCLYILSSPLVNDFYREFKKEIIHARMTGDRKILYDKVGKENFEELNNLINEFYIYFDISNNTNKINNILEQIKEGIVNRDTNAYNEFINRSNIIFRKMQENASKDIKVRKLI